MAEVSHARPGKISPGVFLRGMPYGRSVARPYGKRPPRRYFLIVCEGEETEPNYFKAIAAQLPREMVSRVTVKGTAWADMNPATRVHELVSALLAYV